MTAVANTVLKTIDTPEFLSQVNARGEQLVTGLEQLCQRYSHIGVRSQGLLVALQLKDHSAAQIAQPCSKHGFLLNAPRPDSLRFMPSLRVTETEIASALLMLDNAMSAAHA